MKPFPGIIIRLVLLVVLAAGAYSWAIAWIDSLYAYRSPLHNQPPAPGQPLAQSPDPPITRRLVFVLIDALRYDTAMNVKVMPFLEQLRQQGAWAEMHSRPPSYSAPAYSTLLTGAWPDINDGPVFNLELDEMRTWTQDNLFSAASRAGMKTAISGYFFFEKLVPQDAVTVSFYTPGEDQVADLHVMQAALPWLKADSGEFYQLVLIHLDQVDYAGHYEGGPRKEPWITASRRVDDLLRQVAEQLDLSHDTLFICSDHGQINRGGHGGNDEQALQEPFVLVGSGVRPGNYGQVEQVDVAPTLAVLLGLNIPAASQGHVRSDMLSLSPGVTTLLPSALQAQQSQLLQVYQSVIDRKAAASRTGEDIVTATQSALENSRQARLNLERLPRFFLAWVFILLPWWFWRKKASLVWLILAGLIYLLLFNLRYAILDGRTYSFSSVVSVQDMITFCSVTAGAALLVGWLLYSWVSRLFRNPPVQAAILTLDITLVTMYLVFLPQAFSFALNGLVATWTLPDFGSLFVGLLALIQMPFIGAAGILLAGVAALVSRIASQQRPPGEELQ